VVAERDGKSVDVPLWSAVGFQKPPDKMPWISRAIDMNTTVGKHEKTASLDDELFQEASKRAGDRIRAFTEKLADELGADVSEGRKGD
jgi:hypothetical protein